MIIHPYYIVVAGNDVVSEKVKNFPNASTVDYNGNVFAVHIEEPENRLLFEIAFGDCIVQQITE